ncbi:MAG: MoxR family ATPase [Steroidobacteraceae bacterium]
MATSELTAALDALGEVILGKAGQLRLALVCLLARGHLLIEDLPGVGKTTLAHALAQVLGIAWQRVQFTSDLLPADILGVAVFDRATQQFNFRRGPVFTQLLLADEVNRASPKTQSALLEAMEERQVSTELTTYRLPEPFFVVATQNPLEQAGTFALPESQLDRFLMRIQLGYPDRANERLLLRGNDRRDALPLMHPVMSAERVIYWQTQVREIFLSEPVLDYVQALLQKSRELDGASNGLSPRAGLGLIRAAQAHALVQGRAHVLPDDVQAVFVSVAAHRLHSRSGGDAGNVLAAELMELIPVP